MPRMRNTERPDTRVPRAGAIHVDVEVEELDATDPGEVDDFDIGDPDTEEQWRMPPSPYKYIPES